MGDQRLHPNLARRQRRQRGPAQCGAVDVRGIADQYPCALDAVHVQRQRLLVVLGVDLNQAAGADHPLRLLERGHARRSAHAVHDDAGAGTAGQPPHRRHRILLAGVNHLRRPRLAGHAAAQIEAVHGDQLCRAVASGELHHQVAHQAQAQHGNPILRGDGERLGPAGGTGRQGAKCPLIERKLGMQMNHARVRLLGLDRAQRELGVWCGDRDPVAGGEAGDARAHLLHHAGGGVAHDVGVDRFLQHVAPPQLRTAADEAHPGTAQHFTGARSGYRHPLQEDVADSRSLRRPPHRLRHRLRSSQPHGTGCDRHPATEDPPGS